MVILISRGTYKVYKTSEIARLRIMKFVIVLIFLRRVIIMHTDLDELPGNIV